MIKPAIEHLEFSFSQDRTMQSSLDYMNVDGRRIAEPGAMPFSEILSG